MNNASDSGQVRDPEAIIDEVIEDLDRMHCVLVQSAQHVGYARDALRTIRPFWITLAQSASDDPEANSAVSSSYSFLCAYRDQVRELQGQTIFSPQAFQNIALSAHMFGTTTAATSSFIVRMPNVSLSTEDPPLLAPTLPDTYADRFSTLDPALGNTYRAIWEVLYGTRSDPDRAALYLMRQAFDHLFHRLAPDAEVRASPHWKVKEGAKPDQISREERIRFAADYHIKDPIRKGTLSAATESMLHIYRLLNRAHKRKELDGAKARKALTAMRTMLERWADAVGI